MDRTRVYNKREQKMERPWCMDDVAEKLWAEVEEDMD